MYTIIPSISYATNYLSINVLNINLYTQMQKNWRSCEYTQGIYDISNLSMTIITILLKKTFLQSIKVHVYR